VSTDRSDLREVFPALTLACFVGGLILDLGFVLSREPDWITAGNWVYLAAVGTGLTWLIWLAVEAVTVKQPSEREAMPSCSIWISAGMLLLSAELVLRKIFAAAPQPEIVLLSVFGTVFAVVAYGVDR
jgi:uncharacterized membrane protein